MGLGISQKLETVKPFAEGEKRTLAIRAERIDPKYLVPEWRSGLIDFIPPMVEAEFKRMEKYPTHESRYYEIQGLGTRDLGLDEQGLGTRDLGLGKNSLDPSPKTLNPVFVPVFVQLNHGDPDDDEARLAAIAEDLLTEVAVATIEAPGTAGGWLDTGGISPRNAGGL